MIAWGEKARMMRAISQDSGKSLVNSFDQHANLTPQKQKAGAGMSCTQVKPFCCSTRSYSFEEPQMKKILLAVVMAMFVLTSVGCGGSSPTPSGKPPTTK